MRSSARCPRGVSLAVAVLLLALMPAAAGAATQTREDPSDAPNGTFGKADLRSLTWTVDGAAATLELSLDASTYEECSKPPCVTLRAQIGVRVMVDTGTDGIADAQIVATRNADGTSVDFALRTLSGALSSADCQDLDGKGTAENATVVTTVANGRETAKFSFDATPVTDGLDAFRWAALAQAPPDHSAAGPWDVMPDAANPDAGAANPGDRRCNPNLTGLRLRVKDGVAFPEPVQPTPTATATAAPSPAPAAKPGPPVAVLTVAGKPPTAGQGVTLDASKTRPAPGATIIAHAWDLNGDGTFDTNTGTRPIAHLVLGTASQVVTVQTTDSNFNTGSATITLNPAPPVGGTACDAEASIGVLRIRAACIRPRDGDLIASPALLDSRDGIGPQYAVILNGVALVTSRPGDTVIFDRRRDEIDARGSWRVYLLNGPQGDIMLYDSGPGGFTWPLPAGAGRAGGEPTSLVTLEIAENCNGADENGGALLTQCVTAPGGFPLTGRFDLGVDTDTYEATIDATARIDFGDVTVTGRIRLRADIVLGSIILDGIGFGIEDVTVGPVALHHLRFDYEPPGTGDPPHEGDLWDVSVALELSELFSAESRLIFINGRFNYLRADLTFTPGILVYPAVFLNRFAGEFGIDPLRLGGGLGASFASVLQINANFLYAFLPDRTVAIRLDGTARLYGADLARAYSEIWSSGYFTFGGWIGFRYPSETPSFQVGGRTDFWGEAQPDGSLRFQGDGNLSIVIAGLTFSIHGFINNDWIAGCLDRFVTGSYNWHTRVARSMLGCDLAPYRFAPLRERPALRPPERAPDPGSRAFASQSAPPAKALTVARGEAALVLGVDGVGGAPVVTLTDPKGKVYTPSSEPKKFHTDGAFRSVYLPEGSTTLLRVERPIAGEWTITPQFGSPAIKEVLTAKALPPLKIAARVSGKGRNRVLTWTARGLAGRKVRFTERGKNTGQTIVDTTKESGRIRFTVQDGSAGARRVEAEVSSGGMPVSTQTLARYRAPGPQKAGRPGRLKLTRKGGNVIVTWPRLRGARGFVVKVKGSDGRRESYYAKARKRRVVIGLVGPTTRVDVTLAGWIGSRTQVGPARKGVWRPKKIKR